MLAWVFIIVGVMLLWLAVFAFYKLISRLVDFFLYGR